MKTYKRDLAVKLALAVGCSVFFGLVMIMLGRDIARRALAIDRIKESAAFEQRAIQALVALQEDAKQAALYEDELAALFPSRDGLIPFPNRLKTIAAGQNLSFGFKFEGEHK